MTSLGKTNSDIKNNNLGYTLIELLVGISIVGIIFSVGYAGFRQFSQRQQLAGVAKSITSDLQLIKQKALTGEKPSGVACTKLDGYAFFRSSATRYILQAVCTNNPTIATKTVDLTGITMTVTTNSTVFKVLGQGTGLAATNTITLTQTATGNTYSITIGTGGDIR